ncbi:TPA: hypothetical protein DDZ01_04185 [Candidatus Uhrbacteria bacterium]|nr:MAG: Histidine kinase [Candidatus Uhrbacteria bacterium GW2011_GWF2_40_263]OGL98202.1 MAG: hypothetical protein A2332_03795 [Candidatus Uhrbacteria bacterium RIFOXYB2_FULL_41_18]HBK35162.1 hypothetical protein [Candidatus Uhrbacteria bacterium]HCB56052.1 hypothetical protein [Candidatus Uhrbacteria bacterium]
MTEIVNNLLKLSQLSEDGEKNIQKELIDLSSLIIKTTERLKGLAEKNEVKIFFKNDSKEKITLLGNEFFLIQALTNLIKNAIIYNVTGGRITIHLKKKKNKALINILDTGIGIHSKDLAHVFDRFYRVDKSRSRQTGGSGLGLPIVLSVIKVHKGTIEIQSEPNKGTSVTVSLPIHKAS